MNSSKLTDQVYLKNGQYKDASNFNVRLQLHQRYSLNKVGLHRWVFEQLDVPPRCRVLELGCGAGELWWQNRERLPPDWAIVLSDFSPGMLQEAQFKLRPCHRNTGKLTLLNLGGSLAPAEADKPIGHPLF